MVYCAVYGCKSSNKSEEKRVFHRFPNNTAEAAKWLRFCRRADTVNLKNAAVCGLHFKPSDYRRNLQHELLNPGNSSNRPKLKNGAVPSLEAPRCTVDGDSRIRKQYLHGDAFSIKLQQEEKRCKECGSVSSTSQVSPMVMQNVRLENRDFGSNLLPFKPDLLDHHTERNGSVCDILLDATENATAILNHDYPSICLVCDLVIKDSSGVGALDIYSDSIVTSHTKQQLMIILAVLVDTPVNASKAYSRSVCRRCFNLLDELDEAQHRTAVLKENIQSLYNQSVAKRNLALKGGVIEEEFWVDNPKSVNDPQYQEHSEFDRSKEQADLSDNRDSLLELEQVISNFESKQEPEIPKIPVVQIYHSTGPLNHTVQCSKNQVNYQHKPITIKVCNSEPSVNFVSSQLLSPTKSNPKIKRHYRKRSDITHLCKFCLKVFSTGEKLKMHQKTHTTIECKYCGKVLVRIGAWKNHLKTFHSVEIEGSEFGKQEIFPCPKCDKKFTSNSSLRYHVKLHDGKTYTCEKCNKEFNHPGNLRNHLLIHEDIKFICDKCGKGFRTNFHLIMHDNQTHRKARSWKCKDCGKAFARCATYREHTHRKARSWRCKDCGKAFSTCATYRDHIRSHSNGKMAPSSGFQVDVDAPSGTDIVGDNPLPNDFDCQPINENEDLFISKEAKILHIGDFDKMKIVIGGETGGN